MSYTGVSIGLEHTVYTVSEGVGDVEVCAVVTNGTVERTVGLSVFTDSSAAGMLIPVFPIQMHCVVYWVGKIGIRVRISHVGLPFHSIRYQSWK